MSNVLVEKIGTMVFSRGVAHAKTVFLQNMVQSMIPVCWIAELSATITTRVGRTIRVRRVVET
jgi:hypothetical protein